MLLLHDASHIWERMTDSSRTVLVCAENTALARKAFFVSTEHILATLLAEEDGEVADLLDRLLGSDRKRPILPAQAAGSPSEDEEGLPATAWVWEAVVAAEQEASRLEDPHIRPEHLLLGLLREKEGIAYRWLVRSGLTYEAVRAHVESRYECHRLLRAGERPSDSLPRPASGPAKADPETLPRAVDRQDVPSPPKTAERRRWSLFRRPR